MFPYIRLFAVVLLMAFPIAGQAAAKGNDVNFFGSVLGVEMRSATEGTMTVRLMGFPVPVKLTGDTEIEAHGDEVGLDGIKIGDFVKVAGFFSDSSIVAKDVEVIDTGEGEFRFRGPITAVRPATGGVIITVLGAEVLVNSETKIERRGSGRSTAADLIVGMIVDVRGRRIENQFVARHVNAGHRDDEAIRVSFAGRITAVAERRLTMDTEGGSTAIVLMTTGTTVAGTPAVGKFAEVRGTLNSRLEVVASRIIIKSDRDSDDHPKPRASVEFKKEISLVAAASAGGIRGEAEIEIEAEDREIEQEFKVLIHRAQPNTEYRIRVELSGGGTVDFGAFRTNSEGFAEVKFSRDLRTLLPAGKTVRDFAAVQVLSGTTVVLQGRF